MEHTEGFLRLVEESRARVREISVAAARERMNHGARLMMFAKTMNGRPRMRQAPTTWGAELSSEISKLQFRTKCGTDPLLRGRIQVSARHGQSAENGLHERLFDGRRLACMAGSGSANCVNSLNGA